MYDPLASAASVPLNFAPSSTFRPVFFNNALEYDETPAINYERSFDVIRSSPDHSRNESPSPSVNEDHVLITADQVLADDVLCGRGAGANTHPGNIAFRSLVGDLQLSYLSTKPLDKAHISKSIVAMITEKGGRFLKRSDFKGLDGKSNFWYDIGFKAAREKTCQALRERAPSTFDIPNQFAAAAAHPDLSAGRKVDSPHGIEVNDRDVLMGRGGVTNSHLGNKNYRTQVRRRQREYLAAPKLKKAGVAQLIIEEIYSDGGRFLTEKQGKWIEISKDKAREKTSQALREKAPELRKIYDAAHELVAKKVAETKRAQQSSNQFL